MFKTLSYSVASSYKCFASGRDKLVKKLSNNIGFASMPMIQKQLGYSIVQV